MCSSLTNSFELENTYMSFGFFWRCKDVDEDWMIILSILKKIVEDVQDQNPSF
jgi:hypothetical protein